jgi:UDP-N-acetyl-2-amino-2-deoxyglucuronate dehydrogenase
MGLGFGIVGVGMIAGFHARAIGDSGSGRLVACCDIDPGRAEAFAAAHSCRGYSDVAAFLRHPGLDIVNICTPSGLHLEPALAAIEAGKHLLIEKPIEISLDRIDRIIEAADRRRVTVAGIFQSRFREGARAVKRAVEEGRFGRLVLGDAYVKWYRSQDYYDRGGWKGKIRIDGGGALMNQSIHAIDLLQWFMGPVAAVEAYKTTLGHQRIEVEDVAVAALRFASGALGVIEGSTAVWPGCLKRIELSGTAGSVTLEEDTVRTWSFVEERAEDRDIRSRLGAADTAGGGASDPAAIDHTGHMREFQEIVRSIETGTPPLLDAREARKSVEIILAIYRSAETAREVVLPL